MFKIKIRYQRITYILIALCILMHAMNVRGSIKVDHEDSIEINASHDITVSEDNPNYNDGDDDDLLLNDKHEIFCGFNLKDELPDSSNVMEMTFIIKGYWYSPDGDNSRKKFNISKCESFDEGEITWNTRPDTLKTLGTLNLEYSKNFDLKEEYTDSDDELKTEKIWLRLHKTSDGDLGFESKEGNDEDVIISVEYEYTVDTTIQYIPSYPIYILAAIAIIFITLKITILKGEKR